MHNEAVASGPVALPDPYEAELVARAKERSADAWDEIYTRHYPQIYRYVQARVFDATTAEDLASTVFMGAVKGIGTYKYQGQPLLAWLYRIARNVVGSHQRSMFRQRNLNLNAVLHLPGRVFGSEEGTVEAVAAITADPGATIEGMDLREALAKLPQTQREVLVFKFFVGMDAKEIASVLGKEPAAVYSLQARALETLRRRLR
jgi:RNA polymerase sigma-70 factor (ECF subfamily)